MGSVHKRPNSRFYHGAFTGPDGRRVLRSTRKAKRNEAIQVVQQWEKAAQLARDGRLSDIQARRVIADIYEIGTGDRLAFMSVKEYLNAWLEQKSLECTERTHREYRAIVADFLKQLGSKSENPLDGVSVVDVIRYRAVLAVRVTGATVNKHLKVLRGAWNDASKQGHVRDNVFSRVDLVKKSAPTRRGFTLEELKHVLDACNDEWKSIVLFGFYTGQRLGDLARLTWQSIDVVNRQIRLVTGKTGRTMSLPIPSPLMRHMETLPAPENPAAPLFPQAFDLTVNALSHQFTRILAEIGLAQEFSNRKKGEGRKAKRVKNELSFHSLRHTSTSVLKNAGVSNAIAQELIGHQSEAVSRAYTHIDSEALLEAAEKMPDVLPPGKGD